MTKEIIYYLFEDDEQENSLDDEGTMFHTLEEACLAVRGITNRAAKRWSIEEVTNWEFDDGSQRMKSRQIIGAKI